MVREREKRRQTTDKFCGGVEEKGGAYRLGTICFQFLGFLDGMLFSFILLSFLLNIAVVLVSISYSSRGS